MSPHPKMSRRHDEGPVSQRLIAVAFPDLYACEDLHRLARSACATFKLSGKPFPLKRYHLSLCCFKEEMNVPAYWVEWAREECARIASGTPPFEMTLDQQMSLSETAERKPLVMCPTKRSQTLTEMFSDFYPALGEKQRAPQMTPHVTLLYDPQSVTPRAVEPVNWTIKEIALLISHVGQSRYEPIERFLLCG